MPVLESSTQELLRNRDSKSAAVATSSAAFGRLLQLAAIAGLQTFIPMSDFLRAQSHRPFQALPNIKTERC